MSAKAETSAGGLDWIKWILVVLIVGAGIVANSHYANESLLIRVPALLVLGAVAVLIVMATQQGAALRVLLKESVVEVRKVVWPTPQETHRMTLMVVILVFVMALILWGLDTLLGWIASLILG